MIQCTTNTYQPDLSVLKGTLTDGKWCSYTASGTLLSCNQTAPQVDLSLVKGTYSDGGFCKYTSSGTVLDCNVSLGSISGTPAQYQFAEWASPTAIKGTAVTASKPVCTDTNGSPGVCAGTEGVWATAGNGFYVGTTAMAANRASATQTLAGLILTAPLVQGTEIVASVTTGLTANQQYGTRISNFGQTAQATATLATADYGMDMVFTFGTATPGTYSVVVNSGSPQAMYYGGGPASGVKIVPAVGSYFVLYSFKTGASTWSWILKNGQGTIATF
jgi:hypothetical protein